MKINRIALAATVALSVFSVGGIVRAQAPAAGAAQRQGILSGIDLTAAQRAQLRPIMQATRVKVQAVRTNTALTPDQQKTQIEAIRKDLRTQVMAILTPAQQDELKQKFAKLRAKRGGGDANTSAAAPSITPQTGGGDL